MADEAKLPQICQLLGLEPDTPPEKIREAVAGLGPGEKLDELACRAVSLEPELRRVDGIVDYSQELAHCTYSEPQAIYLPVSSDPTAAHQLALAALDVGLGWPVAFRDDDCGCWWGLLQSPSGWTNLIDLAKLVEGETAMHAAALAVALAGLERSLP